MAVNRKVERAYGLRGYVDVFPRPVVDTGAPTTADDGYPLGQTWIDKTNDAVYVLTSVSGGVATWSTSPASGATTLASLEVTGASDLQGNVTVGGTLGVTGDATFVNLSVGGDFDFAGTGQLDLSTSANQADAIVIEATAGGIDILASGASAGEDIDIVATGSSVNISSSEAVANALRFNASAGGIDVDAALQINIASSQNAADAIRLSASAGGIDVDAVGSAGEDISIVNTGGSLILQATESAADSVLIESTAGGIDILASGASAGEDIDIVATGSSVNISSSENVANAITLNASAGGIDITNTGTAGEDIDIASTGASVNISASENIANAITINASAGGIDVTNTGTAGEDIDIASTGASVNVSASEAVADAITLNASDAASGIDVSCGTGGMDFTATGGDFNVVSTNDAADAIYLRANGGVSETIRLHSDLGTGVASVHLESDVGGITLTATGLASDDAINLSAPAGGVDVDAALQLNLASSEAAADAIVLNASDAASGIDVSCGTGGMDFTATGGDFNVVSTNDAADAIYLRANGGVSETIRLHADQGTGVASVHLESDVGGVTLTSGLASADAINLSATAGGVDVDGALQVNIASSQNAANAIVINASAGGIDITNTGTAGEDIDIASTGASVNVSATEDAAQAIYLHANGGVSETVQLHADQGTGVSSIYLLSDVGGLTLESGLASADAINLVATAGGVDVDGALQVNIASSQNAADAIRLNASAGGIDVDAVGAAGEDIDILNTGGSVKISATESVADAIVLDATAGGIDILASGASAGEDIDITATGSSVNITATEAVATAIVLNASDSAGGIDLTTGGGSIDLSSAGAVSMVPATASVAGTSLTINARVGVATFTGQTTAAGSTLDLTITNSALGAGDGVFCTVSNKGSNDADMTLEGVITETAGTLTVHTKNNGAAALNGDVIVTFWIIN